MKHSGSTAAVFQDPHLSPESGSIVSSCSSSRQLLCRGGDSSHDDELNTAIGEHIEKAGKSVMLAGPGFARGASYLLDELAHLQ
jgi:hypothetical protein